MNVLLEAVYTLLYIFYSYCEAMFRLLVPPAPKSVKDQVVLVTGGAKGIGRETALQLAEKGATIVLWDVDKEGVESTANDLRALGAQVRAYTCDVSSYDDVMQTAGRVRSDVGDVNVLVNNAGIMVCKGLLDLSESDVRRTLGINTIAHFWTIKAFLPAMMSRNKGHIVTISSYAGLGGSPLLTDYTASKFAVRGMTEALERELREKSLGGVTLTTVYPLFTNTGLVSQVKDYAQPRMRFNRLLEPEEVASAIVDGILRNKREVYFPGDGILLPFLTGVLPNKGRQALTDFIDLRFTSTKS